MANVGRPPAECRSFYAAPQAVDPPVGVQIDAMMVAMAQHIPTINGYSGLSPPGWSLNDTNAADYEKQALGWAVNHDILAGLCRLDIQRGTWQVLASERAFVPQ